MRQRKTYGTKAAAKAVFLLPELAISNDIACACRPSPTLNNDPNLT